MLLKTETNNRLMIKYMIFSKINYKQEIYFFDQLFFSFLFLSATKRHFIKKEEKLQIAHKPPISRDKKIKKINGIPFNGEEMEAQKDAKQHTPSHSDSMSSNLS